MGARDQRDLAARAKCAEFGLHPKTDPLGEDHHTDAPASPEDKALGEALAYFLGGLFNDIESEITPLAYLNCTPADAWTRVARALRIHGLKIVDGG